MSKIPLFKTIALSICLLVFAFPMVSSDIELITQGVLPTEGIHISVGALPNSNIILISTGEIDAHNDVWVHPDTEIYWYYYLNSSGLHFLGAECYNPMYAMCPRSSLNVSDNLAHFKSKGRLVSGLHEDGFLVFDFGNESYKVPLSEILPYLWDESWIDYLSGYSLNGRLVFFPAVTIEITGADVKCVDCVPGESVASVRFKQLYNVTYYTRNSGTTWKRSIIKSEVLDQAGLLSFLERPIYVFFYNGTLHAFETGKVQLEYSTATANEGNLTRVLVVPRFHYSNLAAPVVSNGNTFSCGDLKTTDQSDLCWFWSLVVIFVLAVWLAWKRK